jgi:hypothetical protein
MTGMAQAPETDERPHLDLRLSDAAANASWQFMLYKEDPTDEKRVRATTEATRVCDALELARNVVVSDATDQGSGGQLVGQAVKRRLIEHRSEVEPVVVRIVELLPNIRKTLSVRTLSAHEVQFLQSEFAAVSLVLQDRGL